MGPDKVTHEAVIYMCDEGGGKSEEDYCNEMKDKDKSKPDFMDSSWKCSAAYCHLDLCNKDPDAGDEDDAGDEEDEGDAGDEADDADDEQGPCETEFCNAGQALQLKFFIAAATLAIFALNI